MLDRGGDYLFALRANRPAMLSEVAAFFADPPEPLEAFETPTQTRGRVETRRHRVNHCAEWLFDDRAEPPHPVMPGLVTLACVEATRDGGPPPTRDYLSSARPYPQAFVTLAEARTVIERWPIDYNLVRPHSAHRGLTPEAIRQDPPPPQQRRLGLSGQLQGSCCVDSRFGYAAAGICVGWLK